MKVVTLEEIKDLSRIKRTKENKTIEARTNKENHVKSLQDAKTDIDKLDVSDKDILIFQDYIDDIIDADGTRPDVNPMKTFVDNTNEMVSENYSKAKLILNSTERN